MSAYQFSPFAIPPAVTAAVLMLFASITMLTRFSRTSVAMFGMSVAAAAWQVAFAFMYLAADAHTAGIWAKVGCACVPFIAPGVYQFVTSILPAVSRRRIISRVGWIVAAQVALLTITTNYVVTGVRRFWWGFYPTWTVVARVGYLLFFCGLLAAAVAEIVRVYPTSNGSERKRIAFFAIALAIGDLAAADFLPLFGIRLYPFGWMALLAFTAVAIYTARKYGMVPITPSLAANEIISTMRDLLLVSDRDGRIQFANNAACAFLGYAREDIIGRPLEDLLVPADDTEATLKGRWVRDREYVFRTKMGQPIELTLSHSPVTHHGEVTGAVIIGRDLRERKRYEWEARRAVTLLQLTLDSTADGILVIGQDGRVLTWNQRFADMWGIPAELMEQHDEDHDLIGQLTEQLIDPAEFLRSLAALHEHPEVESVHVLEFKDGRRLEQYSIGRYLDDLPVRVWSFRDVTARMAAEAALRDSETRYRLLFEQNAAGVCLATISGRIIDCNATFADMVGYTMDELKNRDLRDVLDRATAMEEIRHHLEETPTVRGVELELRRRDGVRTSALANVSLLGRGERALIHLTAVDISDRKRAEEQIEFQAYHDALTQLPNRRLFVERLEMSLLSAKRVRGNVGVLFIDLDRFKTINDTLGHSVADALLIEVAQRLRSCVRQTDTVARYGGDEFTIILPDLHQPEDAAQVAEKILESVIEPVAAGGTTIELSVSIGIAVYPFDGTDFDTLLRNADDAMYRAKQAGRNGYQLCTEQIKTRAMERLSMQSRLRKAMDDGELVLAYQPQVSVSTGRLVGAEAMIRWNDPARGIVEASEFIPVAEETRLIVPLGEWALFTACRQLRQWRDAKLPPLRMAVNISARQFQQRDLDRVVRRAIDGCGIDPACLELQIRETAAMRDVQITVEMLNLLRRTGVSIAIHDFGSAYSSLGSLQVLPINAVKIDPRSLDGGATAAGDAAIVGAVIDVSRALGLRVVAEGVETREQLELLERRGVQEAQGVYFCAAADPETFSLLMQDGKPLPAAKPPARA
ncbi:MAG TPA: EAL domain-containing protein [Thermoanaerobaculia bacterium]|nr:EAL domain-containing protein [Thermoanaerobaculia bacterium]